MSLITIGYIAIVAMLALIMLGIPIGWSMAIVGLLGELYVTGPIAAASKLSLTLWENGTLFVFIALPLFLLMGQLAFRTGITDDLYDCVSKWFGHLPAVSRYPPFYPMLPMAPSQAAASHRSLPLARWSCPNSASMAMT